MRAFAGVVTQQNLLHPFPIWLNFFSSRELGCLQKIIHDTLFETENERQKTKAVPIPLPRAFRNFPDVKTINGFFSIIGLKLPIVSKLFWHF